MEQLQVSSLAQKLILGGGILLLIDSFFNWQAIDTGARRVRGQSMWHGFWGVLLGLMIIALLAWAIARMSACRCPKTGPRHHRAGARRPHPASSP